MDFYELYGAKKVTIYFLNNKSILLLVPPLQMGGGNSLLSIGRGTSAVLKQTLSRSLSIDVAKKLFITHQQSIENNNNKNENDKKNRNNNNNNNNDNKNNNNNNNNNNDNNNNNNNDARVDNVNIMDVIGMYTIV